MNNKNFRLCLNKELNEILNSYYLYLMNNNIETKQSIEYVHYVLENLDVKKYIDIFAFENNLSCNGIFIPSNHSILISKDYLKKIQIAHSLNFLSKEKLILEYFTLLFHEINHVLQFKTIIEFNNSLITKILNISIYLKKIANYNEFLFHNLFSDEIEANINSGILIYNFAKSNPNLKIDMENVEKNLIYYLTIGYINQKNILPCSQIKFLHSILLNQVFFENEYCLNDTEKLLYGFSKGEETNKQLLKSYQTQKLCLDIKERRSVL